MTTNHILGMLSYLKALGYVMNIYKYVLPVAVILGNVSAVKITTGIKRPIIATVIGWTLILTMSIIVLPTIWVSVTRLTVANLVQGIVPAAILNVAVGVALLRMHRSSFVLCIVLTVYLLGSRVFDMIVSEAFVHNTLSSILLRLYLPVLYGLLCRYIWTLNKKELLLRNGA